VDPLTPDGGLPAGPERGNGIELNLHAAQVPLD
jgi:hypothetical protein